MMSLFETLKTSFATGVGYAASVVFTAKVSEMLGVFNSQRRNTERYNTEEESESENEEGFDHTDSDKKTEDAYKSLLDKLS